MIACNALDVLARHRSWLCHEIVPSLRHESRICNITSPGKLTVAVVFLVVGSLTLLSLNRADEICHFALNFNVSELALITKLCVLTY